MKAAAWDRALRAVYFNRRPVILGIYAILTTVAYGTAFQLRFDFQVPQEARTIFWSTLPALLLLRIASDFTFDLSRARWRFISTHDVLHLAGANCVASLVFFVASWWLPLIIAVPRSVMLLEWFLTTFFIAGLWLVYRTSFERLRHYRSKRRRQARRILIVGAGEAGSLLAREMSRFPTGYRPIGFIDDEPTKLHTTLHGLRVLGNTDQLTALAATHRIDEIVIATPSATAPVLRRLVEACEATQLCYKVLPGIKQVLAGDVRVNQLRELRVEDLLGREPVCLELPELYADLHGRSVLITGAAGSIGSELARQAAMHRPAALVLLDQAETGLFYLQLELRERYPDLRCIPIIADIVDGIAIERVFQEYEPSRVYHAAAYKHVPMMQQAPREAIRNNVIGTWRVADTAGRYGCEKLVLVSTDKAVRPVSIMGASKRLAELVILELQDNYPATAYAAVRFGNVLGSAGSVIPVFRDQIANGRPLTVTHPEATRYFMTIPEAVQLILQASLLPEMRGRVIMLEMGEPVKIIDLAHNVLRIAGINPNFGNNIVVTGLRPGEKLHEELIAQDERTTPTAISKIRLVAPADLRPRNFAQRLLEWEAAFHESRDAEVLAALLTLFPDLHVQSTGGLQPAPAAEVRIAGA